MTFPHRRLTRTVSVGINSYSSECPFSLVESSRKLQQVLTGLEIDLRHIGKSGDDYRSVRYFICKLKTPVGRICKGVKVIILV